MTTDNTITSYNNHMHNLNFTDLNKIKKIIVRLNSGSSYKFRHMNKEDLFDYFNIFTIDFEASYVNSNGYVSFSHYYYNSNNGAMSEIRCNIYQNELNLLFIAIDRHLPIAAKDFSGITFDFIIFYED